MDPKGPIASRLTSVAYNMPSWHLHTLRSELFSLLICTTRVTMSNQDHMCSMHQIASSDAPHATKLSDEEGLSEYGAVLKGPKWPI
jgi:hypothetical protein